MSCWVKPPSLSFCPLTNTSRAAFHARTGRKAASCRRDVAVCEPLGSASRATWGGSWRYKETYLATVEVDDALWAEFCSLGERFKMPGSGDFLEWCLRRIIKFEQVAEGRYVPVSCAIVTRDEAEVLVVGNDYEAGQLLFWNLPGGAVDPGEDLHHAVIRELYEESGLEVLQVGRLAWVAQIYNGPDQPSFLVFAFEVTAWQGDITLEYEEKGGSVRRAEFVPYAEACKRLISTIAVPLHDWLTESRSPPRFYWYDRGHRFHAPIQVQRGLSRAPLGA